jgi:hypothetical protein
MYWQDRTRYGPGLSVVAGELIRFEPNGSPLAATIGVRDRLLGPFSADRMTANR